MCGFIGQFSPGGTDQNKLERASSLIRHRGPDDSGTFFDGPVSFAFRRLAILDLSSSGRQPMKSADGNICVIHNGEIYNYLELRDELQHNGYTFQSTSDTEVIVAAYQHWGSDCFQYFNGMWALAIWDRRRGTLILSRDRFGEKPLYYQRLANTVTFASEMKSIFSLIGSTPPPNEQILCDYLSYGFHDHSDETFFLGIKQLLPGTCAKITEHTFTIERYWSLQPQQNLILSPEEAAGRFGELFTESVRIRLRSDVPVGTCLSGGLDSSSIALVANRLMRSSGEAFSQKTFTAYSTDPRYDERRYSHMIVKAIGSESHEVEPLPERFLETYDRLLTHQEEPFLSMSIFAQWEVMRRAHEQKIAVMLDGQGGDEVLAGYIPFFGSFLSERLRRGDLLGFIRESRAFLKRHRASYFDVLPTFALYAVPTWLGKTLLRLGSRHEVRTLAPEFRKKYFRYPALPRPFSNNLKNHLYRLLTTTGVRALLHYEDRNAMAFSIESRVPFLDHRLAEFTLGLPDTYLIGNGEAKRLLRAAMKGVLPDAIRARHEKMGFVVPQAEWFRKELLPIWEPTLRNPQARVNKYLGEKEKSAVIERFLGGEKRLHTLLWRWYNLETWLKKYHG